jgi:isocitrate dehydrogenase (NAD+)
MMLRHLGLDHYANRISTATYNVLAEGKVLTRDLHGTASTGEFTKAILKALDDVVVDEKGWKL